MRKKLGITIVAATLSLTGTALAGHDPFAGPGGHDGLPGNQGCDILRLPNQSFKNPGKMFQALRETFGENPKQVADSVLIRDVTVGEFIDVRCDDPEI